MSLFLDKFRPIRDQFLAEFWNKKWKQSTVFYEIRPGATIQIYDILDMDTDEDINLMKVLIQDQSWDTMDDPDQKVLEIWKWVINNVYYKGDIETRKTPEYWQNAGQTYQTKKGDCEDGAILIYKLCRLAGVPTFRLKVCAGDVVNPSNLKKTIGHAYIIYCTEKYNEWYTVDWCYWAYSALEAYQKIPHGQLKQNYGEIWFTFNEEMMFAQHNMQFEYKGNLVVY